MILRILAVFFFSVSLGACSTGLFDDDEKAPLSGERIDVMLDRPDLEPDPSLQNDPIHLPPMEALSNWPQTGRNAAHSPGHIAIPERITRAWNKSIGSGSSDESKLLNAPIVQNNKIFTLNTNSELRTLDATTGKTLWKRKIKLAEEEHADFPGGLAADDFKLFVTTGSGEVLALTQEDGTELWRTSVGSPIRSGATLAENKLFVLTYDNHLYVLSPQDGSLLWTHSSIEEGLAILGGAAPAVTEGIVVVPYSSGEIYALRTSDGRYLWHDALSLNISGDPFSALVDVEASPVIVGNVVIATNHNGRLTAFSLNTGLRLWEQELSATQTPWVGGNIAYVVTDDGFLVGLDFAGGGIRWLVNLNEILASARDEKTVEKTYWFGPILAGERLIATSASGYALSFSPADGAPLSAVELKDGSSSAPIAANNTLYFLTEDGRITAYR